MFSPPGHDRDRLCQTNLEAIYNFSKIVNSIGSMPCIHPSQLLLLVQSIASASTQQECGVFFFKANQFLFFLMSCRPTHLKRQLMTPPLCDHTWKDPPDGLLSVASQPPIWGATYYPPLASGLQYWHGIVSVRKQLIVLEEKCVVREIGRSSRDI
jgi:hypothetical protein